GVVSDPQGAVLPGVTVTATSPALIGSRTAVTEVNGTYRIPSLPEGTYALAFELSGFQTYKTREHRLVARADPHHCWTAAEPVSAGERDGDGGVAGRRRPDDECRLDAQYVEADRRADGDRSVECSGPLARRPDAGL